MQTHKSSSNSGYSGLPSHDPFDLVPKGNNDSLEINKEVLASLIRDAPDCKVKAYLTSLLQDSSGEACSSERNFQNEGMEIFGAPITRENSLQHSNGPECSIPTASQATTPSHRLALAQTVTNQMTAQHAKEPSGSIVSSTKRPPDVLHGPP